MTPLPDLESLPDPEPLDGAGSQVLLRKGPAAVRPHGWGPVAICLHGNTGAFRGYETTLALHGHSGLWPHKVRAHGSGDEGVLDQL